MAIEALEALSRPATERREGEAGGLQLPHLLQVLLHLTGIATRLRVAPSDHPAIGEQRCEGSEGALDVPRDIEVDTI